MKKLAKKLLLILIGTFIGLAICEVALRLLDNKYSGSPNMAPYFLLRNGKLELDESFRQGRAFNPLYIKLKGLGADLMNRSLLCNSRTK